MSKDAYQKMGAAHVGALYQKPHMMGWFFRTADSEISDVQEHHYATWITATLARNSAVRRYADNYRRAG